MTDRPRLTRADQARAASVRDDAALVARFLIAHPEFLAKHPELIEAIELPHHSARGAVSLIERQVLQLRDKNVRLARELHELVASARGAESLHARLHGFALAMLDATNLDEMFTSARAHLQEMFGAGAVAIRLYGFPAPGGPAEIVDIADTRLARLLDRHLPLGPSGGAQPLTGAMLDASERAFLFGPEGSALRSCALVALPVRDRRGLLALASREARRFPADTNMTGLARIGELLASAATRLL